eukprot:TRINITY_DN6535_c0_g2_i3.p1 TRINITY_DN6535_c0_g2~~TRINITY_DN6535_c0_g2_i3.p1  ORF type:complete len:129 (+),score=16.30 TRINITY_DN6535_c0_g2_i3:65-451(+)
MCIRDRYEGKHIMKLAYHKSRYVKMEFIVNQSPERVKELWLEKRMVWDRRCLEYKVREKINENVENVTVKFAWPHSNEMKYLMCFCQKVEKQLDQGYLIEMTPSDDRFVQLGKNEILGKGSSLSLIHI